MATSKICMNKLCATTSSVEWKKGWVLGSGGFATLCSSCGSAFENLVFCETYHLEESGWRECSVCHKRLHCGCIASKFFYELLDIGGVACSTCARSLRPYSICRDEIPNEYGTPKLCHIGGSQPILLERRINGESVGKLKLLQLGKSKGLNENESNHLHQSQKDDMLGPLKRDDSVHALGDVSPGFLHLTQPSIGSSNFSTPGNPLNLGAKDMFESFAHSSLNLGFSSRSDPPSFTGRFPNTTAEETERGFTPSPFSQGQRPCPILAKSSKAGVQIGSEAKKVIVHQARVARPPAEGRGRSQLLPRYWPRITDQELQQLSGDLNSTIVPLFEKVLSASDAGRIGRLVLPKACAEAYFPPISQSDGTQIKIQDVKGKEWTFQFRYWPNNNSRMYVLEGVTPCIQSMQLQAGDTVIFSRIDPGGKLVIGSRKASNSSDTQEAETSSLQNGNVNGEPSLSGMSPVSRFSGLFHSLAENKDPHLNALSENLNLADGNMGWHKNDKKLRCKTTETVQPSVVSHEKKRTRNIGSKSKRLLIHSEDAMELKLTWEEAQDLLRPPPTVKPSIVTIEDHEFEEYAEPPVFGRRTIFTAGPSGIPEQWTQCDDCFKCRRLPVDALLPPKWTCVDNVWDSTRCSCSAPEDIDSKELEHIFKVGKDSKKRKVTENHTIADDHEPSGLDALASAAVLGEHVAETVEISAGATTRHPRHRPGCTCIVCIQPPSGKGKHKSSCTCNVCMTVKRRFKTLMLRKKIRQSEREAELAQKDTVNLKENSGKLKGASEDDLVPGNHAEVERTPQSINKAEVGETSAGKIDLNCHPDREVQMQQEANAVMTMTGLVEAAGFPLESYMKRNGFGSLVFEQQASSSIPQGMDESEQVTTDDRQPESAVQPDCESKEEEKCSELAN